jgi:hypothetical protein
VLCLQQHKANRGEPFDPVRTGGDHVGLRVTSREELDEWAELFAKNDVVQSPIADREYGSVLCFKDPDGILWRCSFASTTRDRLPQAAQAAELRAAQRLVGDPRENPVNVETHCRSLSRIRWVARAPFTA